MNGQGERRIMMSETTRRPNAIKERNPHNVSVNQRLSGLVKAVRR